jgi:hypothetical protein
MTDHRIRALNLDLPAMPENYIEQDGGLLVRNVKLLATGTWTDSAVGTPLFYPTHILEKYATNWASSTFWARHSGGQPRNVVTDLLGEVRNVHYEPGVENGAIVGDVFYHMITTVSREGAALAVARAKQGHPMAVSVEWDGTEIYNPKEKRYEAAEMTFVGLAAVDRGACSVCSLPKAMSAEERQGAVNEMEAAELEKILADFKAGLLGEVDKKLAGFQPPKPDEEAKAALEASTAKVAELEERLKKLELEPAPKTVVKVEEKELEAPAGPRIVKRGDIVRKED